MAGLALTQIDTAALELWLLFPACRLRWVPGGSFEDLRRATTSV